MIVRNYTRPAPKSGKGKAAPVMVAFGDSLPDAFRWLEATPRAWDGHSSEEGGLGDEWDLSAGWDGALSMLRDGWSEGALRIDRGLAGLALAPAERTPKWGYDVAGELPDVPRYLSGEPANMRRRGKRNGAAPVVHIVLNNIVSGGTSAEHIANFGLAMAGLVDRLEASGRRVELDLIMSNPTNGKGRGVLGWKVKAAADPMDLAAVAFSVGHPAAFRRIGFAMIERTPKAWETYSYGRCEDITAADAADIGADGAFLINGMRHNPDRCESPADALRFAAEQINKAAGEELIDVSELPPA